MKLRLFLIGIVCICLCVPYIRCFFKRLNLFFKIKKVCQEKGHILTGTHRFWWLGDKAGKNCDCVIETAEERFAVKLFGMPRRKCVLVFTENKEFFIRRFLFLVDGRFLLWIRETFESKAKPFPEYDFSFKQKENPSDKELRKILLINPVPIDMLMQEKVGKERTVIPGDEVYGMQIANQSWLLKELTK